MEDNSAGNNDTVVEVEVIPEGSPPEISLVESRVDGEELDIEARSPDEEIEAIIESLREPIPSPDEEIVGIVESLREPIPSEAQEPEANSQALVLGGQYRVLTEAIAEVSRNAVRSQLETGQAQQIAIAQNLERMTASLKTQRGNDRNHARQTQILDNMTKLMSVFAQW